MVKFDLNHCFPFACPQKSHRKSMLHCIMQYISLSVSLSRFYGPFNATVVMLMINLHKMYVVGLGLELMAPRFAWLDAQPTALGSIYFHVCHVCYGEVLKTFETRYERVKEVFVSFNRTVVHFCHHKTAVLYCCFCAST